MSNHRNSAEQSGQSTIEFALSMVFLLGFALFFLQLSLVMGFGSYVHYATFMAARAYLSSSPDRADQRERASTVIKQTLKKSEALAGIDRFPTIAKAEGGSGDVKGLDFDPIFRLNGNEKDYSWALGIRYTFKSRLFLLPLNGRARAPAAQDPNLLQLRSESYLGREDSFAECQQEMQMRAQKAEAKEIYYDNGC